MGPYRIEQELKKHKIDTNIIYKYLSNIDEEIIDNIKSYIVQLQKNKEPEVKSKKKMFVRWRGKKNEGEIDK